MISYAEYLAQHLDKVTKYQEYIAENIDNSIAYSEYIAEQLDKNYHLEPHYKEKKLREDRREKLKEIFDGDVEDFKESDDIKKDLIFGFDLK